MASVVAASSGDANFQERLDRSARFTQPQLLALVRALADELRDAHSQGRFHGAIAPSDIRFDAAGAITLDGWGRDTTPDAMQTSAYAPIERYAPVHPQGPWTDVYALAAILWRAIAGAPPAPVLNRRGDVTLAAMAPAGFGIDFLRAIDAALEIAPQRRPRDVDSWLARLADAPGAAASPGPERPEASARPSARAKAKRWPLAAAAGVVAAVAGGIYLAPSVEPRLPPPRVERSAPVRTAAPAPVVTPAPTPAPTLTPAAPVAVAPPVIPVPPGASPPADEPAPRPVAAARPAAPGAGAPPAAQPVPTPDARPAAIAPAPAVPIDPPIALLRRADERLRDLYRDYDRLNRRIPRAYRSARIAHADKQAIYRESRGIRTALIALRGDRNRIAEAESFAVANRRYEALAEDSTRLRDRIEMLRRSL